MKALVQVTDKEACQPAIALTQNSDARLKTNIARFQGALQPLQQLSGYRYRWKHSTRDQNQQICLLAQEVQAVFPELVAADDQGLLSVHYNGFVPVLIEAVKAQQQEIDLLNKKNALLEASVQKPERLLLKKD